VSNVETMSRMFQFAASFDGRHAPWYGHDE